MGKNSYPKIQHYVPKFILRNFTTGSGSKIYAFDKKTGELFNPDVKNVAAERGFYDTEFDPNVLPIESRLGGLESAVSPIINKIVLEESLFHVSDKERLILSLFIAVQFLRVKQKRIMLADVNQILEERLRKMGADPKKVKNFEVMDEESIKRTSIHGMMDAKIFVPHIRNKAWFLFKAPKSHPLYVSDNPITMQNELGRGPRGNLGLAVRGIEIYFPISKALSLGLYCESHAQAVRDGLRRHEILQKRNPYIANPVNIDPLKRMMEGLQSGCAISLSGENVINQNSLQVIYSSRFVYSSVEDFSLVRKMIRDNPKFKRGISIEHN